MIEFHDVFANKPNREWYGVKKILSRVNFKRSFFVQVPTKKMKKKVINTQNWGKLIHFFFLFYVLF